MVGNTVVRGAELNNLIEHHIIGRPIFPMSACERFHTRRHLVALIDTCGDVHAQKIDDGVEVLLPGLGTCLGKEDSRDN